MLALDVLGRAKSFMAMLPPEMMDRAIQWAYLHETRDSFAIEKEQPSEEKSRRFVQLLRQAHEGRLLTEDYLVELQNSTVSNLFDKAVAFRHEQNHLHNGLRGAAGVSYVPAAPALCQDLMEELMAFANQPVRKVIHWWRLPSLLSALCSCIRSWTVTGACSLPDPPDTLPLRRAGERAAAACFRGDETRRGRLSGSA